MKNDNYFQVSGWMINVLKLDGTNLIVFAIIYGFAQDGQSKFTGSIKYLQKCTGKSKNTVMKSLSDLVEIGLLKKHSTILNSIKLNSYSVDLGVVQKLHHQCRNWTGGGAETGPGGGAETGPYNTSIDNNSIDNNNENIYMGFLSKCFEVFSRAGKSGVFFEKMKRLYDLDDNQINVFFEEWKDKNSALGTEFKDELHLKKSFNYFLNKAPKPKLNQEKDLDEILALAERGDSNE